MRWEKIAEREADFMKNCLVYESFVKDFRRVFRMNHPDFLTTRKGMSFTHYFNKESSAKLARFLLEQLKKNPRFMDDVFTKGKKRFDNLLSFCYKLRNLENKSNKELLNIIKKYFFLYKEPYPYFHLTVEGKALEKESSKAVQDSIKTMAKLRLYGRSSFNKSHEVGLPLFKEIAKRFNISVKELKFLTPPEIISLFDGEKFDIKRIIKERDNCFFMHAGGTFRMVENAALKIHDDVSSKEVKGQGTFPAKYKGKVKLIKNKQDMLNLKGGEVIVLQMTTTDLITNNLKKVGAIVTDEGGITCHAAILSREFKIPTLIGTKIATKVLKEGDIIEVDTKEGIVRKH